MDGLRIREVARPLAPLTADDTLARAAETLRSVPFDRVPVVDGGRLRGVVTAETLTRAMYAALTGIASPDDLRLMPLEEPLVTPAVTLLADQPLEDAASALDEDTRSAPVVDADGRYIGMVAAADVAHALLHARRPPSIGGMATPLGVYLTTGTQSAGGRGSLGLVLTGVCLGLLFALTNLLTGALFHLVEFGTGIPIRATLTSTPLGWWHLNRYDIWPHLIWVAGMAIFAVLFRLSPLTGYHAAEHQVVHAIEQDRPLTPESVARMPRVHPRCGSRFFAIGLLAGLFLVALPVDTAAGDDPVSLAGLAAVAAVLLWWRRLGTHLQNYVTTRPASPRQLRSAIAAAEELLAKWQHGERRRPTLAQRLWHMGLPQVGFGLYLTLFLFERYVERYVPLLAYLR